MRLLSRGGWRRRIQELVKEFAGSGPLHRRRLANIDIRISVSGVRGKSTAVRWLHDILNGSGYDTYAKVTGVVPLSIYNGFEYEVERSEKVRLYENERQLRRFEDIDAAVVENQGIREYTTRLVNQQYVDPQVIFLTNIRRDHLDTLGSNRLDIARALARSVPNGTHVISGEQDPAIREYLEAELARRDAPLTHVEVPAEARSVPGAELAYGINPVLEAIGEPPLSEARIASYVEQLDVTWTHLPNGRIYNAAPANDVQSTELIRRRLVGDSGEQILPLLYLRADRRGRTATFVEYLQGLAERDAIEHAHLVGPDARLFERHVSFPVTVHDEDADPPASVLSTVLDDPHPVMLMANTVSEFMESMQATVDKRSSIVGPEI